LFASLKTIIDFIQKQKTDNTEELDDEALQSPLPYILEQAYYFEQAGIGLGKDESYR
jgi:radial spoke head protein 4A